MEHLLSLFLLITAVTCVIVATQPARPARPATRRRSQPVLTTPRAEAAPTTPIATYPWGDTQRWSRRDIQQAIAREHAFPASENVWPPR